MCLPVEYESSGRRFSETPPVGNSLRTPKLLGERFNLSTANWNWLIDFCLNYKDETGKRSPLRVLPSLNGEPWVCYECVAALLAIEPASIKKSVIKLNVPRHPTFTGLIQITAFERKHGQET
jgi:hypothetical protein